MDREPSRTPGLPELLKMAADSATEDIFFCEPGKVEKYDDTTQKASVTPLLKRSYLLEDGTKETYNLPTIDNVQVAFQRGGGFFITFPLKKGDLVLLLFCDRSIDKYKSSDGSKPIDPIDLRKHDISDAVAIPGVYPFLKSLKGALANKGLMALGYDQGGQITISKEGVLAVSNTAGNFALKSTGQFDANGNLTVDP